MLPEDMSPADRAIAPGPMIKPMTYSVKTTLPDNPTVRVVFEGLMWFIFHGEDECQVGIHNTTKGTILPHRHPHELELTIWTITGCDTGQRNCGMPERIPIGNPKTIEGIQIDVNEPVEKGVFVYQKDKDPFDPFAANNDSRDWRWVIDFERPPLYSAGIKLTADDINPGVSINHGLFHTLLKTSSQFELIPLDGDPRIKIGSVAQYVAANINLRDGGDVTVTVRHKLPQPSRPRRLERKPGVCDQIDITNRCFKGGKRCDFEPDHQTDKTKRNDFYLYYDTFQRPSRTPEYALKRERKVTPEPLNTDFCVEKRTKEQIESSNEAPCGPVVAGAGGTG